MDEDDRLLLRLAATAPLWLIRYAVARQQGHVWLATAIGLDIALMIVSWRAVAWTAAKWPGRGDPASAERFVYIPAVLAGVLLFFDAMKFLRSIFP